MLIRQPSSKTTEKLENSPKEAETAIFLKKPEWETTENGTEDSKETEGRVKTFTILPSKSRTVTEACPEIKALSKSTGVTVGLLKTTSTRANEWKLVKKKSCKSNVLNFLTKTYITQKMKRKTPT